MADKQYSDLKREAELAHREKAKADQLARAAYDERERRRLGDVAEAIRLLQDELSPHLREMRSDGFEIRVEDGEGSSPLEPWPPEHPYKVLSVGRWYWSVTERAHWFDELGNVRLWDERRRLYSAAAVCYIWRAQSEPAYSVGDSSGTRQRPTADPADAAAEIMRRVAVAATRR